MPIYDYSTTASSNTSISGLTVSDATRADAVDNIVRQMMADLAAFTFDTEATFTSAVGVGDLNGYADGAIVRVEGKDHIKVTGAVSGTAGSIANNWEPFEYSSETHFQVSVQPSRGTGAEWVIGGLIYTEAASGATDHALSNAATTAVKLYAPALVDGNYASQSFAVLPATASPTASTNATQFQAWVNQHPINSTVELPNWEIPLGSAIDIGQRHLDGKGTASKLTFSGLGSSDDVLTIWGGPSGGGINNRAGRISNLSVDCGGVGQDAFRFEGGIGCGIENVEVTNAVRDFIHCEQSADGRYFERFFIRNVTGNICGRYGWCVQLVEFGASDTQFFNFSDPAFFKFTRCGVADVGLRLEDNSTENGTKIGGGVSFYRSHASFNSGGNDSATRLGCGIHIVRGANSSAVIDSMNMNGVTFEDSTNNSTNNGGLLVEDNNSGARTLIPDFLSTQAILTGYGRWWDYNDPTAAPWVGSYFIMEQAGGIYTNRAIREFGTDNGTLQVPANGTTADVGTLAALPLDASDAGRVWDVYIGLASGAGTYHKAIIQGDSTTPLIRDISQSGNLSIVKVGTQIYAQNTGASAIFIKYDIDRSVN